MGDQLPIGIQSFRTVRSDRYRYVDKTPHVRSLVEGGGRHFLSRPRRFGKSLLVSTLKSLFECKRDLFEGLAIEPHWDWSRPCPVVGLSFGRVNFGSPTRLHRTLLSQLRSHERRAGVVVQALDPSDRLAELLEALHEQTGRRVAVLVDEYDKPILDVLHNPDIARANRDELRGLYAVIKDCDEHVRFCFLTGVSKFSKASLFSGLNNLKDITLDTRYSSICGYTENDLDRVFSDCLEGLDRKRIREWYNGYSWAGEERVYNPLDVLLLLDTREYAPWWFETGTPTFLINLLLERSVPWHLLDGIVASVRLLSKFDVGDIAPEALLFQTGYLTILERLEADGKLRYRLGYPNREVRESLNAELLDSVLGADWQRERRADRLRTVLATGDLVGLEEELRALLAGIPHQWHGKEPDGGLRRLVRKRAVRTLRCLGSRRAGRGERERRADGSGRARVRAGVGVRVQDARAGAGAALQQLRERGYADRCRIRNNPVHLVGVEFSAEIRNVTGFEAGTA